MRFCRLFLKKEEQKPLFFLTARKICRMIILNQSVCRESAVGRGKLHAADTARRRAGAKKTFSPSSGYPFGDRSSGGDLLSDRLPAALADGACLPRVRDDAGLGGVAAVEFFCGAEDASACLPAAACRRLGGAWAFGASTAPKGRAAVGRCGCRFVCGNLPDSAVYGGSCGKTGLFKLRFT